jgi:hypothetical protein
MSRCEMCGNDYDKPMQVTLGASTHVFDSFECAMHALAPLCGRCGCRVVGPRGRGPEQHLLLCSLRSRGWGQRGLRPRLTGGTEG